MNEIISKKFPFNFGLFLMLTFHFSYFLHLLSKIKSIKIFLMTLLRHNFSFNFPPLTNQS